MNRRQFRVLYREFLFRMVDLELIAPEGDMTRLLGQFAALLIFISLGCGFLGILFADGRQGAAGALLTAWGSEHSLISTTMLVVGLFAVLSWDSTFPNRRDVMVLAPLPLRARTLFLAKVAAVATALSLTVVTLHVVSGIAWPYALAKRADVRAAPAPAYDAAVPPVEAADLQAVLDRDLAHGNPPGRAVFAPGSTGGATIGVVQHGVRRVFSYGTAKADSIFQIGSITKTFTGLLLAQMVAQDRVGLRGLDEPVRTLLPEGTVRRPIGYEITLLDLATHHSGLPAIPDNISPYDTDVGAHYHAADLYDFLRRHGVARPPYVSFEYSNLNFALLAQALSNQAQTSYADLVREQITGPLGITNTMPSPSPEQKSRLIQGYDSLLRPVGPTVLDVLAGAGALDSTAGDMLRYLDAQLHPERAAADAAFPGSATLAAALNQTHELHADAAPGQRVALAWGYDTEAGIYWHNGATAGYTAYAYFDPRHDTAVVVLFNRLDAVTAFADRLGVHLRQRLVGLPAISLGGVVIPAIGGLPGWLWSLAAYWITMFAAGIFIFCCVLGAQGLAAQLLPRRQFLRLSSTLQMAAFCLFVSVYFLEPSVPAVLDVNPDPRLLAWLPSYWFLGMFQQMSGSLHPALAPLARRAWEASALVVGVTAVAYLLSYLRTLRKIVEEPDIVPAARGAHWLPRFGNALQTAIAQFSIRTLLRSRQHRVILAFYAGIGFALTILFLREPAAEQQLLAVSAAARWQLASIPMMTSSVVLMGFWVIGVRMVFAMPLEIRANWIFRTLPLGGPPECLAASRRALYVMTVAPVFLASSAGFVWIWPWRPAIIHSAALTLLSAIFVELSMHGFLKLPFTCSYQPGKRNLHIQILLCSIGIMVAVNAAVRWERDALENSAQTALMLGILAGAAALARWRASAEARTEVAAVQFDDPIPPLVHALDIHKDGVTVLPAE